MPSLSRETTPDADGRHFGRWRAMTPLERAELADQMSIDTALADAAYD